MKDTRNNFFKTADKKTNKNPLKSLVILNFFIDPPDSPIEQFYPLCGILLFKDP